MHGPDPACWDCFGDVARSRDNSDSRHTLDFSPCDASFVHASPECSASGFRQIQCIHGEISIRTVEIRSACIRTSVSMYWDMYAIEDGRFVFDSQGSRIVVEVETKRSF